MTDKDSAPIFMSCFESLAEEHRVPREAWSSCFTHGLSGYELNTWSSLLENSVDNSYDAIKPLFLDRLGYDWDSYAKKIFCAKKPAHLSYDQYSHEFMLTLMKIAESASDIRGAMELVAKACFSNFLYGFKRTELCKKKDASLPMYVKFLYDCDYNSRPTLGRREPSYTHRRSHSDSEPNNTDSNESGSKNQTGLKEATVEFTNHRLHL